MTEIERQRPTEIRCELKLPIEASFLAQARSWIRLNPEGFRTAFPERVVNNLYLDSPGLTNLAENMAGAPERRKLRLRWYGNTPDPALVEGVLELKIKRGSVGDKRRLRVQEPVDLGQPFSRLLDNLRSEAPDEWQEWLLKTNQPALINRYRREYYVSPDGVVRCTLDYDQTFFDQRYTTRPNLTHILAANAMIVIEVKAPVELSERLERVMDSFPIARRRHSKYVDGLLNGTF